ncbi:RNA-binding protein hfq [Synechococcus moorigangaii CMS01]|nr:RNA-binding protein hfq [Synechococcus moorigangaii CMS01]
MTEFNTGYPSVRRVQSLVKVKGEVEIKLTTNDVIIGRILWQDPHCVCIVDRSSSKEFMIFRQAIAYLKT